MAYDEWVIEADEFFRCQSHASGISWKESVFQAEKRSCARFVRLAGECCYVFDAEVGLLGNSQSCETTFLEPNVDQYVLLGSI